MLATVNTPTNSEGRRSPPPFDLQNQDEDPDMQMFWEYDDEEYQYSSDDAQTVRVSTPQSEGDVVYPDQKTDDDNVVERETKTDYWSSAGQGRVLSSTHYDPLPPRDHIGPHHYDLHNDRVAMAGAGAGRGRRGAPGQTRVITDFFSNVGHSVSNRVGNAMGLWRRAPPKKDAYIFQNKDDFMTSDLTIGDVTHRGVDNIQIQVLLDDKVKNVHFSLGNGQVIKLAGFCNWILEDYEAHMWREIGCYIYTMFGGAWEMSNVYKAKNMIELAIQTWKDIQKEVYFSFGEIVLEREYSDEKPMSGKLKEQINRVLWRDQMVSDDFAAGYAVFKDAYRSKIMKIADELKKEKKLRGIDRDDFYHHMVNFCGIYTMHNRGKAPVVVVSKPATTVTEVTLPQAPTHEPSVAEMAGIA